MFTLYGNIHITILKELAAKGAGARIMGMVDKVWMNRLIRGSARLERRYLDWEYVPETAGEGDAPYRWRDLLSLTRDIDVACALADNCAWQHPETLLEEWVRAGLVAERGGRYRILDGEAGTRSVPLS